MNNGRPVDDQRLLADILAGRSRHALIVQASDVE